MRAGFVLLAAGLAMLVAHDGLRVAWPGFPPGSWWGWLYNGVELVATGLCAARVVLRPRERAAWAAVTIGMVSFSAGDFYMSWVWGDANTVPFPSAGDALYLGFYPAVYVGFGLLLRSRLGRLPAGLWLDGLLAALAVAAVGAAFVFGQVLARTHGAALTVATNLAYPLGDLLLLGLLVGIMALTGWSRCRDWLAIAGGFALFAVVDSIFLVQSAKGTYVSGALVDVGWPAAMALIALAAWRRPSSSPAVRLDERRILVVPAVAAVTCLALEFSDHYHPLTGSAHVLASLCLLLVIGRMGITFAENYRMLRASHAEAVTDSLTGLGNRRALELELERRLSQDRVEPFVLAFYDLDGFKVYNDTFGHQAGDALLARLGARVAGALPAAGVYRMGGDEFCVIVSAAGGLEAIERAAEALSERSSNFAVGCSYGTVDVPAEARDADTAMLLADARMYDNKGDRRPNAATEIQRVLQRALSERNNELGQHHSVVADLAEAVAHDLGLAGDQLVAVRRAAELHDVGKLAIPDAILDKPGPLSEEEWAFMRRHTIVGERIVASATSLRNVAPLVRASHERWDGDGYPDGLAGSGIPLGARIIAVCDAYDAMIVARAHRPARTPEAAMAELRRCSGTQFDPTVVGAFERVLADRQRAGSPDSLAV